MEKYTHITETDDNTPEVQALYNGKFREHSRKAELLEWANKIQKVNEKKNILRSFRIEALLDERAKEQAKKHNLTYTKYLNLALQEFTEKFEELETMQNK